MPTTSPTTFSAFTALRGGFSEALAPGRRPLALSRGAGATWWENDEPVTATLPPGTPVEGASWSTDTELRVGLGVLALDKRAWQPTPALAEWSRPGPRGELPVREVAWAADGRHVALLLDGRGGKAQREVVIVGADGKARGRRAVDAAAAALAIEGERVIVAGQALVVLDLDGNVVAEVTQALASVFRVRAGAGSFTAIGAAGAVVLLRAKDGAVLATWSLDANDALPLAGGVVAVDAAGAVRVACLQGSELRQVAEAPSGLANAVLAIAGAQLVVAGAGPTPVKVATFVAPCQ